MVMLYKNDLHDYASLYYWNEHAFCVAEYN